MRISKIIFKIISTIKCTISAPFLLVIFIGLFMIAILEMIADILVAVIRLIGLVGYSEYDDFIKGYENIIKDLKSNL